MQAPYPVTAPYRVVPAPRPLGGAPHVVLDDAWPAALARRRERLREDPGGVLVRDPQDPDDEGLLAAWRQAWDLLPLPRRGEVVEAPHLDLRLDLGRPAVLAGDLPELAGRTGWELLARAWMLACSDDLVVLRRGGPEVLTAELLAVAFPSGWSPRERAGATLSELHAPVADGERLQRAAPALSEALLGKGPHLQHVWGLEPGGRLDRDPSAPDHAPPGDLPPQRWWLRVERQTSLPLPALGRALFTIRPYLRPLTSLDGAQRLVLHDAVASMSPQALAYKGLTGVRRELLRWLVS